MCSAFRMLKYKMFHYCNVCIDRCDIIRADSFISIHLSNILILVVMIVLIRCSRKVNDEGAMGGRYSLPVTVLRF